MNYYLFLAQVLIWLLIFIIGHEAAHVVTAKLFGGHVSKVSFSLKYGAIVVSIEIPDKTSSFQKAAIYLSPLAIVPVFILLNPLTYIFDTILIGVFVSFGVVVSGSLGDFVDVYKLAVSRPA